jgi:uncharacterized membrane protein
LDILKKQKMKKLLNNFRNTILSGILFFLPIFFLLSLIQKVWQGLTGFGAKLAAFVGVKSVAGVGTASIVTTILLIIIFYICGLLVRFAFIGKFRNWIENTLLQYIPGYLTYKVKMEEKLIKKADERKPVLVVTPNGSRPGLLIETTGQSATVYLPNTPDTNNGQVWVVDLSNIRHLKGDVKSLLKSVQYSGKGMQDHGI